MAQYQVAYNTNGQTKLFEFYLFVNPLGQLCHHVEQELHQAIDLIDAKTDLHILCYTSQQLVTRYMQQIGYAPTDLAKRNEIFNKIYHAALAYKAACLQGKRRGRQFLIEMQARIHEDLALLTDDFILNLAQELGLDLPAFQSDWKSKYVRDLYYRDQQIAYDMSIDDTPSLVVFEQCSGDNGILLQGLLQCHQILAHLDHLVANGCHAPKAPVLTLIK